MLQSPSRASLHLWDCGLQFPLVVQHQHCNRIQQQWERREALWSVKTHALLRLRAKIPLRPGTPVRKPRRPGQLLSVDGSFGWGGVGRVSPPGPGWLPQPPPPFAQYLSLIAGSGPRRGSECWPLRPTREGHWTRFLRPCPVLSRGLLSGPSNTQQASCS